MIDREDAHRRLDAILDALELARTANVPNVLLEAEKAARETWLALERDLMTIALRRALAAEILGLEQDDPRLASASADMLATWDETDFGPATMRGADVALVSGVRHALVRILHMHAHALPSNLPTAFDSEIDALNGNAECNWFTRTLPRKGRSKGGHEARRNLRRNLLFRASYRMGFDPRYGSLRAALRVDLPYDRENLTLDALERAYQRDKALQGVCHKFRAIGEGHRGGEWRCSVKELTQEELDKAAGKAAAR